LMHIAFLFSGTVRENAVARAVPWSKRRGVSQA
jgi:hypothetical protein